jgi:hypothetical protein
MRPSRIDIKPWVTHRLTGASMIETLPGLVGGRENLIQAISNGKMEKDQGSRLCFRLFTFHL